MIDNFSLGLTHALLLYAAWRLYNRPDLDRPDLDRPDLDREDGEGPKRGWVRQRDIK